MEDIVGNNAAFKKCGMCRAATAKYFSGSINMSGASLKIIVNLNALWRVVDAGVFEAKINRRDTPGRDKNFINMD